MGYQSSLDSSFLNTVEQWIADRGEILVMLRFSHAGGSHSYEFFSSFNSFKNRITQCQPRTCIIVFQKEQLPLRGIVDEDFTAKAMALVSDGEEYLIAGLEQVQYGKMSWFPNWSGENHQEMKDDLKDAIGKKVAFGSFPPWLHDNDHVTSAVVPLSSGEVECGVY
jgi:hypothetical protein